MCRSTRARAAALFIVVLAFSEQPALGQPQTVLPWLQDPGRDRETVVQPLAEPVPPGDRDASAHDAAARTEAASTLAAAVIGADRLPPIGRGVSPEVWRGSLPEDVSAAVQDVKISPVRAANILLRELLSTPLDASRTPLANERAAALLRLGALPEALATAHAAVSPDAGILETITRAAILYGHGASPCRHARLDRDDARLVGLAGVFCEALLGSPSLASVRLEVERELGEVGALEADLLDAMIHPELLPMAPRLENGSEWSDFAVGMSSHLGLPIPEPFVLGAPLRQIWRFAEESDPPHPDRLRAMARLEAAGLLDTPSFRGAVLRGEPDQTDEIGVWTALLLQMADTRDPELFGKLVAAGLRLGRRQGLEAMAARLIALPARVRNPGTSQDVSPGVMRRVFLLAGDPDTALLWHRVPAAPEAAMLFSIALSDFEPEWHPADEEELAERFEQDGDLRAGHILAALRAFGKALVNRVDDLSLSQDPAGPGYSSGLLALEAAGLLGEAPVAPETLQRALGELVAAGFAERARQIAVEVILLGS